LKIENCKMKIACQCAQTNLQFQIFSFQFSIRVVAWIARQGWRRE